MQVPELVPEVAFFQGFGVGGLEVFAACGGEGAQGRAPGERLQHRQVGRAGFVQSGQHRVHGSYAALRGYVEVGPTPARMGHAVPTRDGLQRTDDGCSDGYDPAPGYACGVDRGRGLQGNPVELLVRRLVVLEAGHTGVQYERQDLHPLRDEARDELGRKGPSRRGYLGATDLRGVDRLIVARRPDLPDVAVPDGRPVPVQILIEVARQVKGGDPEPVDF